MYIHISLFIGSYICECINWNMQYPVIIKTNTNTKPIMNDMVVLFFTLHCLGTNKHNLLVETCNCIVSCISIVKWFAHCWQQRLTDFNRSVCVYVTLSSHEDVRTNVRGPCVKRRMNIMFTMLLCYLTMQSCE